jgi:hypothetical protein
VLENTISVGELYDAVITNTLDGLRVRLSDVDIEPNVVVWRGRHGANVKPDTIAHCVHAVRTLIPERRPFHRSKFTSNELDAWLAAYPAGQRTRRKAHSAMSNFAAYLVKARVLDHNPKRSISALPAGAQRLRYLDLPEIKRLANISRSRFAHSPRCSAARESTCRRRSVSASAMSMPLDERSEQRDRKRTHATGSYAWRNGRGRTSRNGMRPCAQTTYYSLTSIGGRQVMPTELRASEQRSRTIRCEISGTPMRCAPLEQGRRQNSSRDNLDTGTRCSCSKCTGASRQASKSATKGKDWLTCKTRKLLESQRNPVQLPVTPPRNNMSQPQSSDWLTNSRGGTRTRDPGIMSAVL